MSWVARHKMIAAICVAVFAIGMVKLQRVTCKVDREEMISRTIRDPDTITGRNFNRKDPACCKVVRAKRSHSEKWYGRFVYYEVELYEGGIKPGIVGVFGRCGELFDVYYTGG